MLKKVHDVVARSTFRSEHAKSTTCSDHFGTLKRRFVWQAQRILHLAKSEQNGRFCSSFEIVGRRGAFEEDLQRCISRGRHSDKRHMSQTCSAVLALIS